MTPRKILAETVIYIKNSGKALFEMVEAEEYEDAQLLRNSVDAFLLNRAKILSEVTTGFTSDQIYNVLQEDFSDWYNKLNKK